MHMAATQTSEIAYKQLKYQYLKPHYFESKEKCVCGLCACMRIHVCMRVELDRVKNSALTHKQTNLIPHHFYTENHPSKCDFLRFLRTFDVMYLMLSLTYL